MNAVVEITTLEEVVAAGAPSFAETSAKTLLGKLVAKFEELTGRTLYQGQAEMFLLEAIAYMLALRGEEEQAAFEQNLVAFAERAYLDALGPNNSTYRLQASAAVTTLRFSAAAPLIAQEIVPAGTRVGAGGGAATFATVADLIIPAGSAHGDVEARATETGSFANGYAPGSVSTILDPIAGIVSAANQTETGDGADIEDDDRFRARIAHAHERISKAGPRAGYEQLVLGTNPAVADVAVIRPEPGHINIYPLMNHGAANEAERAEILVNLDPETDIPMGDYVTVLAPVAVDFAINLTVYADRQTAAIQTEAIARLTAVTDGWRLTLGGFLAPSELYVAVKAIPGVIDADDPALAYQALDAHEFRNCTAVTVNVTLVTPQ